MRLYSLPNGSQVDLDQVYQVGDLFVNKNYSQYNCYEVYITNGLSFGIFENDLARATFISDWQGV